MQAALSPENKPSHAVEYHWVEISKLCICVCVQESALYGEHIWFETNVSGDFCYVGEQHCYARTLVRVQVCTYMCVCVCFSNQLHSNSKLNMLREREKEMLVQGK